MRKRERLIKDIIGIRGFFIPELLKMTVRELKKELKLRVKIKLGKCNLW